MKNLQKGIYFFSGVLVGAWLAVLFVKMDFNTTVAGLAEAGNANWDNLRVEMIDTIGLLTSGLLLLSVAYLVILGIVVLRTSKK